MTAERRMVGDIRMGTSLIECGASMGFYADTERLPLIVANLEIWCLELTAVKSMIPQTFSQCVGPHHVGMTA